MSGMYKIESRHVADAINSHFTDFTDTVGRRRMRVRLISIPVSVKAMAPIAEGAFEIEDVTRYLQSFYHHGLINKMNGGIVLLNRLIDHSALEKTSISDLYALSRAIFDRAKTKRASSMYLGEFGKAEEEASWLFVPDGYYTMRHMIGVVYWDEGRESPPMITGSADVDGWLRTTVNSLLMAIMPEDQGEIEINVLPPSTLFDSMLSATKEMVSRVVNMMAVEAREQVGSPAAKLTLGCDQNAPGRHQLRVELVSKLDADNVVASATIQLSIMESMETASVIECVREALGEEHVDILANEYFTGPIMESGGASTLQ